MRTFDDYREIYAHARLERDEGGVLTVTMHSDGGPLAWGARPHSELAQLFADIAGDRKNRVVILTGTGGSFCDRTMPGLPEGPERLSARTWDRILAEGKRLLMNHLDIDVPMIAAINGPATIHAELGVLCDIVLAADHAYFQDAAHFVNGLVAGDGVHVIWPALIGINRARYFLMTGQKIGAEEALRLGIVNEVMPEADLLPRARALAAQLLEQPPLTVRYTRVAMVQQLKKMMLDNLGLGLALEGLAASEYWPGRAKN